MTTPASQFSQTHQHWPREGFLVLQKRREMDPFRSWMSYQYIGITCSLFLHLSVLVPMWTTATSKFRSTIPQPLHKHHGGLKFKDLNQLAVQIWEWCVSPFTSSLKVSLDCSPSYCSQFFCTGYNFISILQQHKDTSPNIPYDALPSHFQPVNEFDSVTFAKVC